MLTAKKAFTQSSAASPKLPQPPSLKPLWDLGAVPRHGQLIMVVGRPGSQKSGFVLYWTRMMNLPTLYFSGDMSPFEATSRLVGMETGDVIDKIEADPEAERYAKALSDIDITFSFGQPIRWSRIQDEIDAWVELRNDYPSIIVVDNLMDIEDCEADYQAQSEAMQNLAALTREYGVTVIVIHHATDKSQGAADAPGWPAPRREVKNGLAEKPQLTLSVALEPVTNTFRCAVIKQRTGKSDPSAQRACDIRAIPSLTRFGSDW